MNPGTLASKRSNKQKQPSVAVPVRKVQLEAMELSNLTQHATNTHLRFFSQNRQGIPDRS
eukprot:4457179-Amphidinium_carterae.1